MRFQSIERWVASLVLGTAGTGIAILWPTHRAVGWAFLIAAGAIGIIAVVWALARWHARKEFEREHEREQPASRLPPIQTQSTDVAHDGINVNVGTISQN